MQKNSQMPKTHQRIIQLFIQKWNTNIKDNKSLSIPIIVGLIKNFSVPGYIMKAMMTTPSSSYLEWFRIFFPRKLSTAAWKAMLGTWPLLGERPQMQVQEGLQMKGMIENPACKLPIYEINITLYALNHVIIKGKSEHKKRNIMYFRNLNTIVILPKRDVGWGGFRCWVAPVAAAPFKLRWSKNNNADVFDNQ